MKSSLLVVLGFLACAFSCTKVENDNDEIIKDCEELKEQGIIDSYAYPIRPSTIEWEQLENQAAKWEAVNVPNDILHEMCTHGLVYTCTNCPLFYSLTIYNSVRSGFVVLRDKINSFAELISRSDAGLELFSYYSTLFDTTWINIEQAESQVQIFHTEIFFAQQEYLGMLNESVLLDLISEAYNILLEKENRQFDYDCINGSYYLISNVLYHNIAYKPLISYIKREELDGFLNDFKPISIQTRDSLKYYTDLFFLEIESNPN